MRKKTENRKMNIEKPGTHRGNVWSVPVVMAAVFGISLMATGCSDHSAKNSEINYNLGVEFMAEGNYDEALAAFDRAIGFDSENAAAYTKKGYAYLYKEQNDEALECFTKSVELDNLNMESHRGLGIVHMKNGQNAEAVINFDDALGLAGLIVGPDEYDIMEYKAQAQMGADMLADAKMTYSALIYVEYHTTEHYYHRGIINLMMRDYESAKQDFLKAVEQDSSNYNMYLDIYYSLKEYQHEEDAEDFLRKAVSVAGTSDEDYLARGEIYYQQGEYENALAALGYVENLDSNGQLYLTKASCYSMLGEFASAAQEYDKYIEKYGQDLVVTNELAVCKMREGDYGSAVTLLETIVNQAGAYSYPQIKWNLIIAYEKAGRTELAYATAAEYINNYEPDDEALAEYEYLKGQLGLTEQEN